MEDKPFHFGLPFVILFIFKFVLIPNLVIGLGNSEMTCSCNYSEVYSNLPFFIQALGQDDRFQFAFQGKKGARGEKGEKGDTGDTGAPGQRGERGVKGDPGARGLPGSSIIYKGNWSQLSQKGQKGERGSQGRRGKSGNVFVISKGTYTKIRGKRGRKGKSGEKGSKGAPGFRGVPGLSIEGAKGSKGEPCFIPDSSLLRGPPGPIGPRGPPGKAVYEFSNEIKTGGKVLIPMPGPKGEKGDPGLSIVGEPGVPGYSLNKEKHTPVHGAIVYKSLRDLVRKKGCKNTIGSSTAQEGTIAYVSEEQVAFIKLARGWQEIALTGRIWTNHELLAQARKRDQQIPNSIPHKFSF